MRPRRVRLWPGRQLNPDYLDTLGTITRDGRSPSRGRNLGGRRPLNPRRSQCMLRPVFGDLGGTIRPACRRGQEPKKRIQADSDTNTQNEAHELSDRLHRIRFRGTTAPARHVSAHFQSSLMTWLSYQGFNKKQSMKEVLSQFTAKSEGGVIATIEATAELELHASSGKN
jgi:hypothetical protein